MRVLQPLSYTMAEAGEVIGCSRTTIWRLVQAGRIPAIEIEGVRGARILHEDLVAFLKREKVRSTAEQRTVQRSLRVIGGRSRG